MRARYAIAFPLALLGAANVCAQSTTYKCMDPAGRPTYTNVKEEMAGKRCTVVSREVSVVPVSPLVAKPRRAAVRPAGDRVDANTQRSRDDTRRRILEEELEAAEKRLAESRQKLAQQDAAQEVQTDPQKARAQLKANQEEVERQEQNVASLKREISNLR